MYALQFMNIQGKRFAVGGLSEQATVKPGLHESELYKILDYSNFLPGLGKIPFNTTH